MQKLVVYTHDESNWFFVGIYNEKTVKNYSSINKCISRAKHVVEHNLPSLSGFVVALTETNYQGWQREIQPECYETVAEAKQAKIELIQEIEFVWGRKFIGSIKHVNKKDGGDGSIPAGWNRKWICSNMTQRKIKDKIDFILNIVKFDGDRARLVKDAYFAVVMPDSKGPRSLNIGDFDVESLTTLYKFIKGWIEVKR